MKKIILAVTALTLSAGAFASIDTNHKARSINAGVYASQEQAYAAGFKKIEQLQALPSNKLANELSVWQNSVVPKVSRLMVLKLWFNLLRNSQVSLSIARLLKSTTNTKLVKAIATKSIKLVSDGKGLPLIHPPTSIPSLLIPICTSNTQFTKLFYFRSIYI